MLRSNGTTPAKRRAWERVRDQVLPLFEILEDGGEVSLRALPLETVSARRGQTEEEDED